MKLPGHLYDLLSSSAVHHPQQIAVEDLQGGSYTYAELVSAATGISRLLSQHGIGEGHRIGILAPKSTDSVAAIFGILKNGSAYVPMDFKAPLARNAAIFSQCGLQAMLIEPSHTSLYAAAIGESHTIIPFGTLSLLLASDCKERHTEPLAYIINTSGSTGVPKGVMHTHKSAMAFIEWSAGQFMPTPGDRFGSHAPFHFDLSVFDLFVPIATGGTVVLIDEKTAANPLLLAEALASRHIGIFYATPSTLSFLQSFGKMHKHDYSPLKLILFAGEVFPIGQLKAVKAGLPGATFYNLYGPTETNVCTYFHVPQQIPDTQQQPFPIGKACAFAEARTSDDGELLICGDSLMLGYWNDAAKTSAAFEMDEAGTRWYKTGDLVEQDQDGQLIYKGRKDRMVKRKGYRIELGDIEHALSRHPQVAQAAVTAIPKTDHADTSITAHIAWKEGDHSSVIDLISYCQKMLPDYMLPDHFLSHAQLPQTSTNKIDYKALTLMHD